MRKLIAIVMLAAGAACCSAGVKGSVADVVPAVNVVELKSGEFVVPAECTYYIKSPSGTEMSTLGGLLQETMGFVKAPNARKATLVIEAGNDSGEGYELEVTPKQIKIKAAGETGAYYGLQTLWQMLGSGDKKVEALECVNVKDAPRLAYRGLLFDVSRHFRSVDFLKKQIDAMSQLKLNNMHLHLTDGAGWRLEVDGYPRLTEYSAWRPEAKWEDWSAGGARYCDRGTAGAYGGYYTKDEIRDLVKYAREHHINIVPEIELPGHSEEVLAAYPELKCDGVEGAQSEFCIGKEATFEFLENVIGEVIDLFPSEYIHIGGDEAGKGHWEKCESCQRRMAEEGLKSVDELQSYAIARIERFINSRGRKMIGYDEILEGGLAPNATVMSWRGTEGGLKAMESGHDVIMSPGEWCYLDYCQDAPFREPVSIGGYTPLSKTYGFDPLPAAATEKGAAHLMGIQGNLWTEYIPSDSHCEYMYYPRAYAIAESGWSIPERKNYENFRRRALKMNEHLTSHGYTTFNLADEYGERRESLVAKKYASTGAKVRYDKPYHSKYTAGGDTALTDGVMGGWTYGDRRWQGFLGDMDVTLELDTIKPVHYIGATFMHSAGAWVHLPQWVEFSVSTDGREWRDCGRVWCDVDATYPKALFKTYGVTTEGDARFVRVKAQGHDRDGAWLFTDEIVVE